MRLINVALSCQNMALKKWSDAPKMLFMKGVRLPVSPFLPLRDPQGYNRISLSLSGRILKEYQNIVSASKQTPCAAVFHGVCEIALTEVLATQMGVMRRSKKISLLELYKFNPLSPHCGSIARELVHYYTWGRLRIVTVRDITVGRHS